MGRLIGLLVAATVVVALPACSGSEGPSSSTTATANPTSDTVDPADPLAYVSFEPPAAPQCVALGRRFALELAAEPSAGLRWEVIAPAVAPTEWSVVVPGGSELVSRTGARDGVETQRITFAAASLGEAEIVVRYVAADGSAVPGIAEETWAITVTPHGTCPAPPVTETTLTLDEP